MSLDQPNEYEHLIEAYAEAVRREHSTRIAAEQAAADHERAKIVRQSAWKRVSALVPEKIKPGIYRLHKGHAVLIEAVLIEEHHDYPEVFPMFR